MAGDRMSVGDLAAAVVAQDEGIRNDLKGLVGDMIKHMRYTMRHGDPSQKTALSKQIIPQLLTAINKVDADEGEAEEKAAYERLLANLRGEQPVAEAIDVTPQATEDLPAAGYAPRSDAPRKKVAAKKRTAVKKKAAAR